MSISRLSEIFHRIKIEETSYPKKMESKHLYTFPKLEGESNYQIQAIRITLALTRDNLDLYLEEVKPTPAKPIIIREDNNREGETSSIDIKIIDKIDKIDKIEVDQNARKAAAVIKSILYNGPLL